MPPDLSAIPSQAFSSPIQSQPSGSGVTSGGAVASPAATAAASPHASPVSRLDPSTGLVVLEFYNAKGDETASLPTRRQLELYRRNEPSPDICQPAIRTIATSPEPSAADLPKHA